ncbi:MAG TPA: MotA/TolQ/ExbB proton channel family protein [Planctomycetia bacterium]|jgi:biopolymer transport protein ExbB|nr:MotA/TolQ/ExbB proton channel family protein [Planctomycetia bacterium]
MHTSASPARQKGVLWLLALCLFWISLMATAPVAQAQEKGAGDGAAAAPAGGAATPDPPKQENMLFWIARVSGVIGLVILLLSIYFVSTVIGLFMEFKQDVAMPPAIVKQADELLEKRDFAGVFNLLKGDKSFYAKVLTAGMAELPNGIEAAKDVADRQSEVLTIDMEKKISMLAVLGTLGPMIGLLGTLKGMISAFGEISRSGQQLDASKVAESISEALLITFEGVALSVPAIFFFSFFKSRLSHISGNASLAADHFLRKFYAAYKKGGPAPRTEAKPG